MVKKQENERTLQKIKKAIASQDTRDPEEKKIDKLFKACAGN